MAKKYTIKDFFENRELLAIHAPTEEDKEKVCRAFNKKGYTPKKGGSYKVDLSRNYRDVHCYGNDGRSATRNYYKNYGGSTILTMNDIIFEDEEEYNVKIEVKYEDGKHRLLLNGNCVDSWNSTETIKIPVFLCVSSIIKRNFNISELEEYLILNHLVKEPTKMTIEEIEEKLGIENLEIIE